MSNGACYFPTFQRGLRLTLRGSAGMLAPALISTGALNFRFNARHNSVRLPHLNQVSCEYLLRVSDGFFVARILHNFWRSPRTIVLVDPVKIVFWHRFNNTTCTPATLKKIS
jgi:hypothetical protein